MKAVVAAFNQEKALVEAFSVLTNLRMELFQALTVTVRVRVRVRVTVSGAGTEADCAKPGQTSDAAAANRGCVDCI